MQLTEALVAAEGNCRNTMVEMISEFSGRAQRVIADHEASFPGTARFLAAIGEARESLAAIEPAYSFTFHLKPSPASMGDSAVAFPRLLSETEGWLGFIVHSVTYRLGQFLDDVVTGINDARPYRSVGAARSLVELCAFVHYHTATLMRESAGQKGGAPPDFRGAVQGVVMTLKAAHHFAQATRFNWSALACSDLDEFFTAWDKVNNRVKATQVLTLIDKLPGEEKRAARFFYEMLCDYVHPNVAAHTLVVNHAEPVQPGQMRWDLSCEPDSDEALAVLIHAIAIPVRHSVHMLLHDISQLQAAQNRFGKWKRHCEVLVQQSNR